MPVATGTDLSKVLLSRLQSASAKIKVNSMGTVVDGEYYPMGTDSKEISKVYEKVVGRKVIGPVCQELGLVMKQNTCQNSYPDYVVTNGKESFAVDVKTTYLKTSNNNNTLNGFTLGTYNGYFHDRSTGKSMMTGYTYGSFTSHICVCVVYKRHCINKEQEEIEHVAATARYKWQVASRCTGSGNTCNIGGIKSLKDLVDGNSIFSSEEEYDEYWLSYKNSSSGGGNDTPRAKARGFFRRN